MNFKPSYFEALDLMNEAMVQRNALLEELKRLVDIVNRNCRYDYVNIECIKESLHQSKAVIQQIEWA